MRNTLGVKPVRHDVQLFTSLEQDLHGEAQETHTLFKGIVVEGHVPVHEFPSRFRVLHDVQFD